MQSAQFGVHFISSVPGAVILGFGLRVERSGILPIAAIRKLVRLSY